MERRHFLTAAGAATLLSACKAKGAAEGAMGASGESVTWRLASSFPRSLDVLFGGCDVLAKLVEAMSGGLFKIQVYSAGEIVPALQVLDAVQQGSVQMGQTASYYYTGKNPALAFDACVPFGLTTRQQIAWLNAAGGLDLMRAAFADFGVLNFPAGNTGAQMGGWFKRNIDSVEDLKGLKIRVPGLGGEVMSRLGATVQVLAGGDIYPALERGAIDATEWVGPVDDEKLGFHKIAKLYYYPGFWEPGPNLSYYVNKAAWDKLPKTYQDIFSAAAAASAGDMLARYDAQNPEALGRLLKEGVKLMPFPDDLLKAAQKTSNDLLEEQASKDASYRKIYEHWKKFREASSSWFGTAELTYAKVAYSADAHQG